MKYCHIRNCPGSKGCADLTIFRLPKEKSARQIWVTNISRYQPVDINDMSISVCERHFEKNQIRTSQNRKRLRDAATPTIFDPPEESEPSYTVLQALDDSQLGLIHMTDMTAVINEPPKYNYPTYDDGNKNNNNESSHSESVNANTTITKPLNANAVLSVVTGIKLPDTKYRLTTNPVAKPTADPNTESLVDKCKSAFLIQSQKSIEHNHMTESSDSVHPLEVPIAIETQNASLNTKYRELVTKFRKTMNENDALRKRNHTKFQTIKKLRNSVKYYKEKSGRLADILKRSIVKPKDLSDEANDIISQLCHPVKPYTSNFRKFSLTVRHHAGKSGYNYLRRKFDNHLPAPSTIKAWLANSDSNCRPGFIDQSIISLENIVKAERTKSKDTFVSISFDEMAIRRKIQWIHDQKAFCGFVTYGKRPNKECAVANNAIFFLLTFIENGHSLLLGYFLIRSLKTQEKKELLLQAIINVTNSGAQLVSIAFDGLSTNFSVCQNLGASFEIDNIRPYIINPINNTKILIIIDPPHMLKLVRNCIAAKKQLFRGNSIISWRYFENLVRYKTGNDCDVHKMNRMHFQWERHKMNVKIAAQTLSNSVALSMETFLKANDRLFSGSAETITFTKNFNKIFDIFNAKHENSDNPFKVGLSENNAVQIFDFLSYMESYIKSITLRQESILKTGRKTGFLGFLINIESLKILYEELIVPGKVRVILFFYFGQDMLESLFSRIRGVLGGNTNPTALQLMGAVRKLTIRSEFTAPQYANCEDHLNILSVPSTSRGYSISVINRTVNQPLASFLNEIEIIDLETQLLDFKSKYTIRLRAGAIERQLKSQFNICQSCFPIFDTSEKIGGTFFETRLVQRPTVSTVKICEVAFKLISRYENLQSFDYKTVYNNLQNLIPFDELYFDFDFEHNFEHKSKIISTIADEYIRIHAAHAAHCITIESQGEYIGNREIKLRHFRGQ